MYILFIFLAVLLYFFVFSQFGPKVVNIKPLVKQIGPMMEHRDADVRGKTKALAIEIYRWIGNALKPQLQTLTQLQVRITFSRIFKPFILNFLAERIGSRIR